MVSRHSYFVSSAIVVVVFLPGEFFNAIRSTFSNDDNEDIIISAAAVVSRYRRVPVYRI